MSLENKIALVTGASRGIGQAIAIELGLQQAAVIGTATTQAGADRITATFGENKIKGKGLVLNVTDSSSINDALGIIKEEFGAPTILVNNAGITRDNLLLRMKEDEWESIIDTNLNSIYRVTKACLRGMLKAKWGRIINITSVVALTGNPGQSNYVAAKAGIIGFSKSLAQEVASRNITVNAIAPGFIATDMTNNLTDEQKEMIINKIPLNRMGSPKDIAAAALFLASDSGCYITGETLHVNGGMYMS